MAKVRFGSQLVRDHAQNGYLAVPTRFGTFPPVVEFPNFLGVAFVDILHHEAEVKNEEAVEELSCQVHHVDHGKKNMKKRSRKKRQQAEEDEKIISHHARLSNSGKSVLVGKVRINLNNRRSKIESEQVIPAVAVENTFQTLTGKKEMNNTFKGKLPPKPIKFKQVWQPKKVQRPRLEEAVPEEEALREARDVKVPNYQRPPRGFQARVQQGGACAYACFHNKRAELWRSVYLPLIRENSPALMVSTTYDRRGATRVVRDRILHLADSPLRRARMLRAVETPQDGAESNSDKNDVMCGHTHEQTGRAKPQVSVFERLSFHPQTSRRVERDWSRNLCMSYGRRYGALPTENEEIIELAERPGAVTRRRAAAAALATAYRAPNAPATQMTAVTANVITTQGSGGSNEFPPPPLEMAGGTVQETPAFTHLDPAVLELLQRYQAEIEALKKQIRGKEAEGHTTREAEDYIQRWRNLSMRCKRPPHQEDAVQICKQNLKRALLERMIGMEIRSFDRLNNVVAEIEAFMTRYSSNTSMEQKNKLANKKLTGKEVNTIDLKNFEQHRGVGSPGTNPKTPRRNRLLQDKVRKPYSFPKDKTKTLFEWATHYDKITFPTPKRPAESGKNDDPLFCPYHQVLGHNIEDCYVFKDIMESLIKKGELQMGEYKVTPPQPHEAPVRQPTVNMVSLYQQLPEEISEASTQMSYEHYILAPARNQECWKNVLQKGMMEPSKQPTPQMHVRGMTPQPSPPTVTPVCHLAKPRVISMRNTSNRRRQTPLPLYRGGSPSLEQLQAIIDESDNYEQPERHPVQLQEYVPWEVLEILKLEETIEQEISEPQEELFWGQVPTEHERKKKRSKRKEENMVATFSCNTISSLPDMTEHGEGEEINNNSNGVNQIESSNPESVTRSRRRWEKLPLKNRTIILRGEASYKISEPEIQGMQAPPSLKVYENQEARGKIPSFVEFLALREHSESSHAPQLAQERIGLDLSNPVNEVSNKARPNNKKEGNSKPLANIPRIPADDPAKVAQSQKYQQEIEMLRKQIQEKEAYILASKEMEGLMEALQSDINPSRILPTVLQSMPAHTGGISLTHPCQMTPEQLEIPEPEIQEMDVPPPLKVYEDQEAGGKIPSFVEFLALREQSESSHAPPLAQERIGLDLSNPVNEVSNKARSNNKKEGSSKPLANIPRIPADDPARVAQSQKYQLEIEMLRKQIQEKEAYILASKEMEGLIEALQSDINPSRILPTVLHSMPAHTGGISLTHPCQMTPKQLEVHSTIGQEFALEPQLTGMSGSTNATLHDSAAPCLGVHDMHHTEAMRNVTRGPTFCRSLSSRCTYSNRHVKPMAERLGRQGVLEAGPYMAEEAISATKLHAISQGGGEPARDYI
ncbi:hypothetical protein Taro_039676 [Colocasia esculenta]|uniref:Uncharacterized protein n=1 Tax=Colocasia esculenta TaxID=4460 RepID=A0A843WH75_COLES|nr:hypothetical protein [Colocasia esculenta]